jgi:hypothetical protein
MLTALAGVIHERQSAADYENNRAEDNNKGRLHANLRCGPLKPYQPPKFREPKMNWSKRAGQG